jgi:hypothetical protein
MLCVSPQRLHPNGSFSRDSQVGIPKLSRVGVSGLWTLIAPRPELGSGRGFNQSYSSCRDLSNNSTVPHSLRRCQEEVNSWLLVVGSQTNSLTPDPSFAHNLGWRCPNGPCKAILGIYTSRPFHWYDEHTNARRFDPANYLLSFRESRRTPSLPLLGVWVAFSHLAPKWGCDTTWEFTWECEGSFPHILLHSWGHENATPGLSFGPHPCKPFALVTNPRLGLRHITFYFPYIVWFKVIMRTLHFAPTI